MGAHVGSASCPPTQGWSVGARQQNLSSRHSTRDDQCPSFLFEAVWVLICEAKANGYEVPIDIVPFSQAIMSSHAHPEVHLQFGKHDGTVGRSNLHCWKTQNGSVLGGWLYELDSIAVSVLFVQAKRFEHRADLWDPKSHTSSKRFQIADFMYSRRAATNGDQKDAVAQPGHS